MENYQLGKDIQSIISRLEAIEKKLQIGDCGCSGEKSSKITLMGIAEKTNAEANKDITIKVDEDEVGLSECTNGHLRRKTVNGVCYCQMCCNGQWVYFCWPDGSCFRCGMTPITVNCGGNNWILSC